MTLQHCTRVCVSLTMGPSHAYRCLGNQKSRNRLRRRKQRRKSLGSNPQPKLSQWPRPYRHMTAINPVRVLVPDFKECCPAHFPEGLIEGGFRSSSTTPCFPVPMYLTPLASGWGDAHASYPYVMGRPPGYHPHPQPYGHYAPSHPGHMQPAPGYGQPPHASSQPPHPDPGFGQGRHHPQAMHGAGFGQGHPQPGSARSPHHPPGFGPSNHHGPAHTPGYVHVQPRTHPAQQQDNASQHPPSPGYGQGNLRPGPAPSGQAPVLGQRESVPSPAGPTQQPPTPRYGHDARSPIGHEGSGADPPHNLQANTLPTLDSKVATAHQQVNESQAPSNESGAAPAGKPTNRLSLSQELSKPTSEPPIGDIKAMDKNHANLLEEALVVSQQHLEISGSCSSTAL